MKYQEIKVSIPEPCHEDWNQMTTTEKGKFCGVCTKEVIDFTAESDETIVKHFQKNMNVCGRFHTSQLDRKLIVDRKKRNYWLSYAASLLLPMTLFSQEAKKVASKTPKTEQTDNKDFKSLNIGSLHQRGKIATVIQNDSIVVTGTVTDDTGLPLPGATIQIKGTETKAFSDFDGNFNTKVKRNDVLMISYTGYETFEIKAVTTETPYKIELKPGDSLELVAITGYSVYRNLSGVAGLAVPVNANDVKVDKKKARKEKRERRRAEREKRRAERKAKKDNSKK
ncbi:carboxypeptidase-like regulatory domain-containing protein [Kordia sp. YSTF-M3]|uniref:Carboxypeptidase-like regulatory domain-containing protein n=1 Tax=Kordia aestuariivivens TaxID=2759037 RepID=A0ABR7QCX8_9FLAO|nr:carboxypeptidase-like regulatory domain-containing protein [Kordia aestuariivivens]MBC8756231.1 carboxypeptidase-like regulatory domain-containing protein [Kordia aestuariivivens]